MEDGFFIKILVVGDPGVGKSSILNQYCHNRFDPNITTTIGCDFNLKILNDYTGQIIRLQLWDVAGQERFQSISKLYIRGALGAIVVCDVTSEDSLNSVIQWKNLIDENSDLVAGESIPLILVQNKIDLLEEDANLDLFQTEEFLQEFAETNGFIEAYQVSAKANINLKEIFNALLQEIFKRNILNESEKYNSLIGTNNEDNQYNSSTNNKSSIKLNRNSIMPRVQLDSDDSENKKSCCQILIFSVFISLFQLFFMVYSLQL